MATYTGALQLRFNANEDFTTTEMPAASGDNRITHDGFDISTLNFTSSSTPDLEKVAYFTQALTAGSAVIDLTALTHNGTTVDFTGKKVRAFLIKHASANTGTVTVEADATNGYNILGSSGKAVLNIPSGTMPGVLFFTLGSDGTAVSGSAKRIKLTGTGTESFYVAIWAG